MKQKKLNGSRSAPEFSSQGGYRGDFPKLGVPFWGVPMIKNYSILGSMLGFPYLGKVPQSETEESKWLEQ